MEIARAARVCLAVLIGSAVVGMPWSSWGRSGAGIHYVDPKGDDARDGLSPQTAWRSLERVNTATLVPGDRVLFRRGAQWRGQLLPQSGDEGAPVTYGAYGEGPKPSLLGSVALDRPGDWQPAGPNLWTTAVLRPSGRSVLTPELLGRMVLHREQGALAKGRRAGNEYTVHCERPGTNGSHIQLYLAPFAIEEGRSYELRFRARASRPLVLAPPHLMTARAPWQGYSADRIRTVFSIGGDWTECVQLYRAAKTADDARLTFGLGDRLAAGDELSIADLRFVPCEGVDLMPCDVGNVIFDHGAAWGVKRWSADTLTDDRDYWYDPRQHRVLVRLAENPARRYGSVELALNRHIISQGGRHWVVYENLDLRYGAAHGIGGGSTHHITVRDCDISWIGGGHQLTRPDGKPVRFGNGVEFWGSAHDCLVERCRLWEIYDAALTNQNKTTPSQEYNLVYRNNVIWNCEYSFEYWNSPEESQTHHIYFEHNTCFGAGHGWGHSQRPNPAGRHLCFYTNRARTHDFYIRHNIFCHATDVAFDALWWAPEAVADKRIIVLDHNCWFQPEGTMIRFKGQAYTQAEFGDYQRRLGQDQHSLAADPRLVDPARRDFRLRPDSPCREGSQGTRFE